MIRPRVLLADDHSVLLEATTVLLHQDFEIVGAVSNGMEMVSEALRLRPDVIVADITMPELSGIDAASKLRESGCSAKLVFLTIHAEEEFVQACMVGGAQGYVLKGCMKAHLIPAIHAALAGKTYISPLLSVR